MLPYFLMNGCISLFALVTRELTAKCEALSDYLYPFLEPIVFSYYVVTNDLLLPFSLYPSYILPLFFIIYIYVN